MTPVSDTLGSAVATRSLAVRLAGSGRRATTWGRVGPPQASGERSEPVHANRGAIRAFFAHVFRGVVRARRRRDSNPTMKKVVGKRYCRLSVSTVWQREAGPRAARHEESPPTRPAGDRAQARGGRPSALEQQRHVVAGPMRCANPERQCGASPTHWKRGRANPPRANVGRLTAPNAGDGPMERRILTGARPRRQVAGHCANALDVAAEPNAGPNRRGLTPLSRLS